MQDGTAASVLAAETGHAGLLVMGSHARGPIGHALVGSVATHVLRHAHCPVIVCPPPSGRGAAGG